jgi:RNA polymerase sigma-70 factor (ECF subfamily)
MNDEQLNDFLKHRPLLFSIGYRMMGSADDAEDLIQETYIRYRSVLDSDIRDHRAYLVTLITRLAIDQKRSAYEKRRGYTGPWLPEPIIDGVEESVALADSAGAAFLLLLERLAPVERAVFLLRDVFDYEYREIAEIVQKNESHCRKIAERSRKRIKEPQRRVASLPMPDSRKRKLLRSFQVACARGDLAALIQMLAEDVSVQTDGGGKVVAALRPVYGADPVGRFFIGIARKFPRAYSMPVRIGDEMAVVLFHGSSVDSVTQIELQGEQVSAFYTVRNPDKLTRIQKQIDGNVLLRLKKNLFRMMAALRL